MSVDQSVAERLRVDLSGMVERGELPGAHVRIEQDGRTLADVCVGYQDVAARTPLAEDSLFRLYSMSKPITSVAIMMLAEQGLLSLDDPASRFLPEFADMRVYESGGVDDMRTVPIRRPITIADLLSHSSGITYHFSGETPVHDYYRRHGVMRDTPVGRTSRDGPPARNLDELVTRIAKAPLLHQPGERFAYSYSTTMLGAVVERATGQRLDTALQAMIFDPLDMVDTGFFVEDADLSRLVTNYAGLPTGLLPIETAEGSEYRDRARLLDGGGALAGTMGDYLNFCRMLVDGGAFKGRRLLSPESVREMMVPRVKTDMPPVSIPFGYGFALGDAATEAAGVQPAGTASWGGSASTYFFVDPKARAIVVLMTHILVPPPMETGTTLRRLVNRAAPDLIVR
jgi:CubicO group peptidase (beta-lactamase class C family)